MMKFNYPNLGDPYKRDIHYINSAIIKICMKAQQVWIVIHDQNTNVLA